MLVRINFILNENCFISPPTNLKPPSLHADQDSTIENQQDSQSVQAIPEMTAKSANSNHRDYGTIIIHNDNHHGNQYNQVNLSRSVEPTNENRYKIVLEPTSNVTDKISTEYDIMHPVSSVSTTTTATTSSLQPQNDNEPFESINLTSYHGILSKKPVSSLLLESPIPSCIGSIDFNENHSFLTDDETITSPANLIFYKKREDFYPQKITEQRQQKEGKIYPPALNHDRRQTIHKVLGKAVTRIYSKPNSIHESGGMPVFKPSGTYKKPKELYRKIKTLVKQRK